MFVLSLSLYIYIHDVLKCVSLKKKKKKRQCNRIQMEVWGQHTQHQVKKKKKRESENAERTDRAMKANKGEAPPPAQSSSDSTLTHA